jgi:hypothetical protein
MVISKLLQHGVSPSGVELKVHGARERDGAKGRGKKEVGEEGIGGCSEEL